MVVGSKQFSRIAAVGLDLVQILIFAASTGLAFGLRFDFKIPSDHYGFLAQGMVAAIAIKFLVFRVVGVHQLSWRHVGVNDLMSVLSANLFGSALLVGFLLASVGSQFPRSVYVLDLLLCLLATGGVRLMARVYLEKRRWSAYSTVPVKRILIYGAGDTGVALAREINSNPQLGKSFLGLQVFEHQGLLSWDHSPSPPAQV